jgi:hypothetical protein
MNKHDELMFGALTAAICDVIAVEITKLRAIIDAPVAALVHKSIVSPDELRQEIQSMGVPAPETLQAFSASLQQATRERIAKHYPALLVAQSNHVVH